MTSSQRNEPEIVGVLNITKDSFSDGGVFLEAEDAKRRADELIAEGATIVDVGGDSSRPGSRCVGVEEEWRRISPVLETLAQRIPISVDTHHAEIARRSIECGAKWINDVSCGFDPAMFQIVAKSEAKLVLTYTRWTKPHEFGPPPSGDLIHTVSKFLLESVARAEAAGVKKERIILDPGMGGFLSEQDETSFELVRRFGELSQLNFDVMLSASRKGFLRYVAEKQAKDRDPLSAMVAATIWKNCSYQFPKFVRAHNPALHRDFFRLISRLDK